MVYKSKSSKAASALSFTHTKIPQRIQMQENELSFPRFVVETLCERLPLEVRELSANTPPQSFHLVFSKSALTIKPTLASFIKEFTEAYPGI